MRCDVYIVVCGDIIHREIRCDAMALNAFKRNCIIKYGVVNKFIKVVK